GENGIPTRQKVVDRLNVLGCYLDHDANQCRGKQVLISTPESKIKAVVTPTDEELMIAMETVSLVQ
ncbi:MAG: acetate kinase, partial [Lentisphaerae bacterium]|nr:acetate kinase [Lentisphaerota bacterium]